MGVATLQTQVAPKQNNQPKFPFKFEVVKDYAGNKPVKVHNKPTFVKLSNYAVKLDYQPKDRLKQLEYGTHRVRLFVPLKKKNSLKFDITYRDSVSRIFQSETEVEEEIELDNIAETPITYSYETSNLEIRESFLHHIDDNSVAIPYYDGKTGLIKTTSRREVTGSVTVRYTTKCLELNISYSNGYHLCDREEWLKLQTAWRNGSVSNAGPPEIKLKVFVEGRKAEVNLSRLYSPDGAQAIDTSNFKSDRLHEVPGSKVRKRSEVLDSGGNVLATFSEVIGYKIRSPTTGRVETVRFSSEQ